jgi:hypothetical protein
LRWPMDSAALEHYGIDPEDPKYEVAGSHSDFCPACRAHFDTTPVATCDLELARAADIEAEGFPARFCFHCHMAYPAAIDRGAICPACRRKDDRRDALSKRRVRRYDPLNAYVADGVGCVEKVPKWMVDWDVPGEAA